MKFLFSIEIIPFFGLYTALFGNFEVVFSIIFASSFLTPFATPFVVVLANAPPPQIPPINSKSIAVILS